MYQSAHNFGDMESKVVYFVIRQLFMAMLLVAIGAAG